MNKTQILNIYDKVSNICQEYPKTTTASVTMIIIMAVAYIVKMFKKEN